MDPIEGTTPVPPLPTIDALVARLTELGVPVEMIDKIKNELGAAAPEDLAGLTESDLTGIGMKPLPARKLLGALKPPVAALDATPAAAPSMFPVAATHPMSVFVIPDVVEGSDFLSALSASKTLNVDDLSIRAALEALFADNLGLSSIPERLSDMIEQAADEAEVPASEATTDILKFVRERRYAEVNVDSRLVTKERKDKVLRRLRELPAAMFQFHAVVGSWYQQLEGLRRSNPLGVLSPSGVQYPPPDDVIGAAETVVGCLTKAFAGFGVQVARAMAYEGMKIRDILNRPDLPALTGSVTKELMLKKLGCELTNADVRTERAVASYVLFVATQVPTKLPAGQEGPAIEALFNLGQRVQPWMQSSVAAPAPSVTGIGGTRRRGVGGPGDL